MPLTSFPINTENVDNNPFPSVLLVEQAAIGSPAVEMPSGSIAPGQWRIFIRQSDGQLCRIDDGGNIFEVGGGDVSGPGAAVDDRIVTFNGTTGKLVQDGGQTIADVIAAGGGAGGMVKLARYTPSGAASVDITSVLSSSYDTYLIVIDDAVPASNGVTARLLVSVDNGANWHASTYHWSMLAYPSGSGTGLAPFDDAAASWQIGGGYSGGGAGLSNGANDSWSAWIRVSNVNGSRYKLMKGEGVYGGNQANASTIQETFGGAWETTTAINALQIKMSSGNWSGNVTVFGIQK